MKKTVLALVVAAAATGVALSAQAPAQTAPKQTTSKSAPAKVSSAKKEAAAPAKAKARVETAEVVSTDANAKSITVKPKSGENQTYTATGAAVAQLAKVQAGEQVRLTVRDNDVTRISPAHMAKHSSKKAAAKKTETK